ncbi:MAG: GIY-YIG nuclease family protein [Defluviitaleaceae bacterium]|nr:GIY-YIG nuclease family protein [Defluviitaleaceae bacterium]
MDKSIINSLPNTPGCYVFSDTAGSCLYVGKSKRVRNRVRSYFNKSNPPKIIKLAKLIAHVEYRPAPDELSALYLEHSLIKTYRPPFNSQMKKDPHPHYICIEWDRAKPGIYISDRPGPKATRYGGFTSAHDAKEAITQLSRTWATPICERCHFDKGQIIRSCLNMHIGRCHGPCMQDGPAYRENLLKAAAFMQGRNKQALSAMAQEMKQAAGDMDFEKAARLRDAYKELKYLHRRFSYRVPFANRRVCVLIKGYNEPGFLLLYYKNNQPRQAIGVSAPDDWPAKRDDFVNMVLNISKTTDNTADLGKIYPSAATQEIRARKLFMDITKTSKARLASRLDKAIMRFIESNH